MGSVFCGLQHFLQDSRISWISCRAFPGVSCRAFPGVSCFMSCEFSFSFSSNANWHRLKISDYSVKLKKNICHSRISRIRGFLVTILRLSLRYMYSWQIFEMPNVIQLQLHVLVCYPSCFLCCNNLKETSLCLKTFPHIYC